MKYPSEKMVWGWEGITFSVVTVVCFLFLLAFVFVVAVAVVCLFVLPS